MSLQAGVPAPQDYRDGKATGAAQLAARAKKLRSYGVELTVEILEQLASEIIYTIGGDVTEGYDE